MYLHSDCVKPVCVNSNSSIIIASNAHVVAPTNINLYPIIGKKYSDTCNNEVGRAFIYAQGKSNIEICAKKNGVLNGKGVSWHDNPDFIRRPHLIRLVGCKNVKIHNLTLLDSPFVSIQLFDCENVVIEHVDIVSNWGCNNDGIDVDCCRNVIIRHCNINTGDDCIAIKATSSIGTDGVTIEKCILNSYISAFKIGTETVGDIKNIVLKDCKITAGANICAIKILTTDGGKVDGLVIKNVVIDDATGPIFMAVGNRNKTFYSGDTKNTKSSISNVLIENVTGRVVKSVIFTAKSINACVVASGQKDSKIKNLTVKGLNLTMPGGVTEKKEYIVKEMGGQYPEFYSLGMFPSSCAYFRHVEGLAFLDNEFTLVQPDVRDMVAFEDVTFSGDKTHTI